MDNYIDPKEATRIRIFEEGDHWAIDAANEENDCTEKVWTHYNDEPLTRETAIKVVNEFAQEIDRLDLSNNIYIENEDKSFLSKEFLKLQ